MVECCMCGDYGLSQELFRCKICKSRFQHKYCSNQYPKAESYKACNWCLQTQKHDSGNSPNSSSSCRNINSVKNKRNPDRFGSSPEEGSPVSTTRKRGVVVEGKKQVVLRKSKSANHIPNGGGGSKLIKPVVRHKVRRYKLLDEVSSQ